MTHVYFYLPRKYRHRRKRGGSLSGGYLKNGKFGKPVQKSNAAVVPIIAEQSQVPIPITKEAAKSLQSTAPQGSIAVANANTSSGNGSTPDFNALASEIAGYVIKDLRGRREKSNVKRFKNWVRGRKTDVVPKIASRVNIDSTKQAIRKGKYLTAAAPIIGRIADAFVKGTGKLITDGLLALAGKTGWGFSRGGKAKRKPVYIVRNGRKMTFRRRGKATTPKKDINRVVKNAVVENEKKRIAKTKRGVMGKIWDKIDSGVSTATNWAKKKFSLGEGRMKWLDAIAKIISIILNLVKPDVKPDFELGKDYIFDKIKGAGMRRFKSQKARMAWVRSFKRRKGAGHHRRRRRHHHKRGGGRTKLSVYSSSGIFSPRPHLRKRGKGLVSSGILGYGDPRNPSGWCYNLAS